MKISDIEKISIVSRKGYGDKIYIYVKARSPIWPFEDTTSMTIDAAYGYGKKWVEDNLNDYASFVSYIEIDERIGE